MPVVYNLLATACPPLVVPAGVFSPNVASFPTDPTVSLQPPGPPWATSPVVARTLPPVWVPLVNTAIAQADLTGRLGGVGGYGVEWGLLMLDLDSFGLPITQGVASLDKPVMMPRLSNTDPTVPVGNPSDIAFHVPLTDNQDNYIWLGVGGALSPVLGSLTPPSGVVAYLGRAHMAAGVLTRDASGVLTRVPGGLWERRTADPGMPGDTPPAGIRFLHHSLYADYLWNGTAYQIQDSLAVLTPAQITADQNDYPLAAGGIFRLSTNAARTVTGFAGGVDGRRVLLINVGAQNLIIANQSTSSAAANRVITGSGASVTVGGDGAARLIYDGTTARWRLW